MKRILSLIMTMSVLLSLTACGNSAQTSQGSGISESAGSEEMIESEEQGKTDVMENNNTSETLNTSVTLPEDFVAISGGTYLMGSPETENWRGDDETQHEVTVSDFAMCVHEVTQAEYEELVGKNPSSFVGEDLPVDSVSWLEAVTYCNLRSEAEGLTPVYEIGGENITWNRSANGYRLPTEAEWEYACRAGTTTP